MRIIETLAASACLFLIAASAVAETRETGNFNYPVTKKMSNPLFVEFDSPMWGSDSIGSLYTADASAHVWADGRLYLYASHDMQPARGCDRMDRYHVFSTDDMVNWTDHGEILNSTQVEWGRPEGGFMWAPDCAYRNGTYYFYFPHPTHSEWWHSWRTGVATSKDPASGFVLQGYIEGAPNTIDPCVFIDDDGQAYFYNGGGGQCFGGKLKENMVELDGEMKPMEGLEDFHEGTWIHKFNGKYYLTHADNHPGADGNRLRYAVSDSPLGPWKDMGVYLFPTGCGTSHGSIVNYKGKWYAFYHTSNYSGEWELRSVCFDPIEINPDGTLNVVENWGTPYRKAVGLIGTPVIIEAEDYNRGGNYYAYHKRGALPSKTCYRKDDIGIVPFSGGKCVAGLNKGEWMRYSTQAAADGKYSVTLLARSSNPATRFHLSVNGIDQSGSVSVIPSGKWVSILIPEISIDSSIRYLDLRIEDGTMDVDKLILVPVR